MKEFFQGVVGFVIVGLITVYFFGEVMRKSVGEPPLSEIVGEIINEMAKPKTPSESYVPISDPAERRGRSESFSRNDAPVEVKPEIKVEFQPKQIPQQQKTWDDPYEKKEPQSMMEKLERLAYGPPTYRSRKIGIGELRIENGLDEKIPSVATEIVEEHGIFNVNSIVHFKNSDRPGVYRVEIYTPEWRTLWKDIKFHALLSELNKEGNWVHPVRFEIVMMDPLFREPEKLFK